MKTSKMPPGLKRYWQAKQRTKGAKVAKRRRKSSKRRSRRSKSIVRVVRHHPARRRRRSSSSLFGGGGGMLGGIVPSGAELKELAATGVYGFLEGKAKTDANHILNKLPKPIVGLGYAGNVALVARVVAKVTRNSYVALFAKGAAHAAMYQMGRRGGLATDTAIFTVAGDHDDGLDGAGDMDMDGLAVEGDEMDGVPSMDPNEGT